MEPEHCRGCADVGRGGAGIARPGNAHKQGKLGGADGISEIDIACGTGHRHRKWPAPMQVLGFEESNVPMSPPMQAKLKVLPAAPIFHG